MSPQFKNLARLCTRCISALALTVVLGFSSLQAQEHYTWVADDDGSWMDPDNWFPRGVPGLEDEDFVIFDHDGNFTITEVPHGIVLRGMELKGKGTTILMAELPNTEIYMGVDDPNPIFKIGKGANLIIMGENSTKFIMSPGRKGVVDGSLIFVGSSLRPTNHQFELNEANMLQFRAGSSMIVGTFGSRYTGFPFGNKLPNHSAVFESGSKMVYNDGSDPFGPTGVAKIQMLQGSNFDFASPYEDIFPVFFGRNFSNFTYSSILFKNLNGLGNTTLDTLSIFGAGFSLNPIGGAERRININGDVLFSDRNDQATYSTLRIEPQSTTLIFSLFGSKNQIKGRTRMFINGRARVEIQNGANYKLKDTQIEVSNLPELNVSYGLFTVLNNASLDFSGEETISGGGRFSVLTSGRLGIASTKGINRAPLNEGNITTATRTIAGSATIRFIGSSHQLTGNGIPTWNNVSPRQKIEIDKPANSTLTFSVSHRTSEVEIKSGRLNLNGNILQISWVIGSNPIAPGKLTAAEGAAWSNEEGGWIEWMGSGEMSCEAYFGIGNMRMVEWQGQQGTVNFGANGQPTIEGELRITNNTAITGNPPFYASKSLLTYAHTGNTPREIGTEWTINATEGRGVPVNVQVGLPGVTNTRLSLGNSAGLRYCSGLMRVGHPGTGLTYVLQVPTGVQLEVGPKQILN